MRSVWVRGLDKRLSGRCSFQAASCKNGSTGARATDGLIFADWSDSFDFRRGGKLIPDAIGVSERGSTRKLRSGVVLSVDIRDYNIKDYEEWCL